ncbi:hypothetical protein [Lysobacter tyrosinilyticus]
MKLHFWERIESRFRHSPPSAPTTGEPSDPAVGAHGSDRLRAWLSELRHDLVNLDRANIDRSDQDEPPRPH